ncbi:MAG: VWA domain-containing protein, partial [Clostridiales bacterium]|nr:VWA domain-containing protein [Clostridiales bacterium]
MKRILSVVLIIAVIFGLMPNIAAAETEEGSLSEEIDSEENDDDYDPADWIDDSVYHGDSVELYSSVFGRYTVLTLDVSGSMSSTELSKMKEASLKFCQTILSSNGTNKVAVVKFGSSASIACGFTDSYSELQTVINGLSAGGGTDMAGGLTKTAELFEAAAVSAFAEKNIIIFSDGAPNSASAALSVYNSIADDYNIYSLGYSLSSSGASFMSSIQNSGYYNVTSSDEITAAVAQIAEKILEGASGSLFWFDTQNTIITVYKNKKSPGALKEDYTAAEGALVVVDGAEYTTNSNGRVTVPN